MRPVRAAKLINFFREGLVTYGVRCKTCDDVIVLGEVEKDEDPSAVHFVVPVEPILCPHCGGRHHYGPEDALVRRDAP
jgi:hypothetical protein